MRWIQQMRMRFQMLFHRGASAARLDDELHDHLERQIVENLAAGMSPEEARYAALRTFGNPALLREQTRATWSWAWAESLISDVRYCIRTLLRTPGFAAIAILVMALGIGANVALFTVVRSVLLNPLPYRDSNQLVSLYEHEARLADFTDYLPVDVGSFIEWQKAAQGVAQMAMLSPWQSYNVSAEGGKLPERIDASWCSWNLFSTLGVSPALGRSFSASDDQPNTEATVILSAPFWRRRYDSDPAIVGKKIWLDAKPYTVIGVLPASFAYAGAFSGNTMQAWTPINHEAPPALLHAFDDHELMVVARLLPGTTLGALVSQLNALQSHIKATHPGPSVHDGVSGRTMLDDVVHNYKTPLYALLAATGCVLLISCMNVASLLVARSAARKKELAIRVALGGGRMRLVRERLIESSLLSIAGGCLGLLFAGGALQWLIHSRSEMNRIEAIHFDGVVAIFASGTILLCALFAGLVSAFSSSGKNVLASLHESSRAHSAGRARATLRRTFLVLEVGLTVVLLVGAGLLVKSYQRLRSADIGVPIDNVLTMHFSLPEARYKEPVQQVAFFESVIARVRALPGVQAAGLVSTAPGGGWGGDEAMSVVEHPPLAKGQNMSLMVRGAEPGYFAAIQIPLLRGHIFTSDKRLDRAHVAVISQAAAQRYFPGEDPVGKHLKVAMTGEVFEVLGVVGDTRWYVSQPPNPTLYWPIYGNDYSHAAIVVRSLRNVEALSLPVQKIIGSLDADLPVSDVMTLRQSIGKATVDSQFDSLLVLAFAAIALILAAAGLYGVLAYLVTQRTGEIGIRIALGARRVQVMRKVLLDGLNPALIGLVFGLAASAAVVRLIRSMLYETEPLDAAVFATVAAILLLVAAMACVVPAWRASRLDPIQALRTE
jgi:putative ABC transport system permease protein